MHAINILVLASTSILLGNGPAEVSCSTYNNRLNWEGKCITGQNQSPVNLTCSIKKCCWPSLTFDGYDEFLSPPVFIKNTGYTVGFDIPPTTETQPKRPSISGGILKGTYVAIGIHFHWGSPTSKGSEHTIQGKRYDVELHIVHRNTKYNTTEEALTQPDGFAVVAIFLKAVNTRGYDGMDPIFNQIVNVINCNSQSAIDGLFKLNQLLSKISRKKYYAYEGSLTTPPCSESVTFIILIEPIPINQAKIASLWILKDCENQWIVNNYRPIQPLNGRVIYATNLCW